MSTRFRIREIIRTLALFFIVEIIFNKAQFTAVAHLIHAPSNTLPQQHYVSDGWPHSSNIAASLCKNKKDITLLKAWRKNRNKKYIFWTMLLLIARRPQYNLWSTPGVVIRGFMKWNSLCCHIASSFPRITNTLFWKGSKKSTHLSKGSFRSHMWNQSGGGLRTTWRGSGVILICLSKPDKNNNYWR